MDKTEIIRLAVERYRRLWQTETDETKRRDIELMVANLSSGLAALLGTSPKGGQQAAQRPAGTAVEGLADRPCDA
jgi:hypothetical protein